MSKAIDKMTDEELLEQIGTTLEQFAEAKKQNKRYDTMPKEKSNPDFSNVIQMLKEDMNSLAYNPKNYREPKDFQSYVYEKVCIAVFGEEYFKWRKNVFKNS